MARIFVSSTFKDLEGCREKVITALKQMIHKDVAMENYVAEDKRPVKKCLEDVVSCDIYIGIFAWRYGYVPDGYDKSITELEYRKAAETGKTCLIFLLHEDALWPIKFVDKGKDAEKIAALRNELSTKHMVSFFRSVEELPDLIVKSVQNWEFEQRNEASLLQLGNLINIQGNYEEAAEKYTKVLNTYEELGDKRGVAKVLTNLGDFHNEWKNYEEAAKNYKHALKIYKELEDKNEVAKVLIILGDFHLELKNYEEAVKNYSQASEIYYEIGGLFQEEMAHIRLSIGDIRYDQRDYESAEYLYTNALEIYEIIRDKSGISIAQHKLEKIPNRKEKPLFSLYD